MAFRRRIWPSVPEDIRFHVGADVTLAFRESLPGTSLTGAPIAGVPSTRENRHKRSRLRSTTTISANTYRARACVAACDPRSDPTDVVKHVTRLSARAFGIFSDIRGITVSAVVMGRALSATSSRTSSLPTSSSYVDAMISEHEIDEVFRLLSLRRGVAFCRNRHRRHRRYRRRQRGADMTHCDGAPAARVEARRNMSSTPLSTWSAAILISQLESVSGFPYVGRQRIITLREGPPGYLLSSSLALGSPAMTTEAGRAGIDLPEGFDFLRHPLRPQAAGEQITTRVSDKAGLQELASLRSSDASATRDP